MYLPLTNQAVNALFKNFVGTQLFWSRRGWQLGLLVAVALTTNQTQPANAEGSVNLTDPVTANDGFRPFLDTRTDTTGGIPRQTRIRVFVRPGETINLGSSANGVNQGLIRYAPPAATTQTTCPTTGNLGRITSRQQELAGPLPNVNGYEPCVVTVGPGQEGIWEIEFVGPNPNNLLDPTPSLANEDWNGPDPGNASFIRAWDVTVRNAAGGQIPGRAYANYLPLNMGGNGSPLTSDAFFLTEEGYQYRIDLNGIDPFGFIFFANNRGFRNPDGSPVYGSVRLPGDVHPPGSADTNTDTTHKIFFQRPSDELPETAPLNGGTTWLRRPSPIRPPDPTDFRFTGVEGTIAQAGTITPRGGNFAFSNNTPRRSSYRIILDLNQNGNFGDGIDRILVGIANPGANTVFWDGLDARGNTVPPATIPYGAQIVLSAGEIHFPIFDPENIPNGLTVERLNEPVPPTRGGPGRFEIFYDDSRVTGPGEPNPVSALQGINSSPGGGRGFDSNFGDNKGIETWTYYPSEIANLASGINIRQSDLKITKVRQPGEVVAGGNVRYTVEVTNAGPSDAAGLPVTDTIPPELTGATWTCAVTQGTGSCAVPSGTGNINTTVNLNNGARATFTITAGVIPSATGTLSPNTATVRRLPDVTDPVNDDNDPTGAENRSESAATVAEPILPNPVQPVGTKSVRIVTDADGSNTPTTGDTIEYTVTYTNTGRVPVDGFLATDPIDTTNLRFVPGSYNFSSTGNDTTVTGNPAFNGATDPNLTNPNARGVMGIGGQVVIRFQAVITAATGVTIANQASATFTTGGTVQPSLTDALANQGDLPQVLDDGVNQGNLPNTADDDPTLLTVVTPTPPQFRLVKRITNLTRGGAPIGNVDFNSFVDTDSPDDDAALWTTIRPTGVPSIPAGNIGGSGDEVEYTIYFLSSGGTGAQNVRLCDAIPRGTTFIPDSFSAGSGVSLNRAGTVSSLTNAADADVATFITPLAPLPSGNACQEQNNPNGSLILNLGDVPNTPNSNFGFVRFRVRLD